VSARAPQNVLTAVPDLRACPRLAELRLGGNRIARVASHVGSLQALRLVDLGANRLPSWDAVAPLRLLRRLANLNLKGNPLTGASRG
jgi:Leucine-rich repeat (LRR) protein